MMCGLCGYGERRAQTTTITVSRPGVIVTVRSVPADVCDACGKVMLSEAIVDALERMCAEAQSSGASNYVREFSLVA
jgi:YgiT-type zinc finger domain-containing protein